MTKEDTFGARFKEFGESKFPSLTKFAEYLGKKRESLYPIIKNESKPGSDIIAKLDDLNCDLHWLFSGQTTNEMIAELRVERDLYKKKYKNLIENINVVKIFLDNAIKVDNSDLDGKMSSNLSIILDKLKDELIVDK